MCHLTSHPLFALFPYATHAQQKQNQDVLVLVLLLWQHYLLSRLGCHCYSICLFDHDTFLCKPDELGRWRRQISFHDCTGAPARSHAEGQA
jgi:hypothetical protein